MKRLPVKRLKVVKRSYTKLQIPMRNSNEYATAH